MPKELFFKICPEKQRRILDASKKEFSEHIFEDASINHVIKNADISRGSFYQYFEDKKDLFFFLLKEILQERLNIFLDGQTDCTDMFDLQERLFIFNLNMLSDYEYRPIFCNFFRCLTFEFSEELKTITSELRDDVLEEVLSTDCDVDQKTKKVIINIMQLATRDLLAAKILNDLSDEEVIAEYRDIERVLRAAAEKVSHS
ncbi:MAG: TetR/AcrR family transcriptional regulator [Coriobacteriia bacterium]|nr:TetR/AcrR family transcriptional regulator [Coriobacteriia bacterium]